MKLYVLVLCITVAIGVLQFATSSPTNIEEDKRLCCCCCGWCLYCNKNAGVELEKMEQTPSHFNESMVIDEAARCCCCCGWCLDCNRNIPELTAMA